MKETTKNIIQSLLDGANATTGNQDTNLTDGVNSLIEGYGSGGGDMPIAEQSSFGGEATGGSKFYYNGVLLPEIPQDVLAEYPYCWIRKNTTSGNYDLIFGVEPWYYNSGVYCHDATAEPWYIIAIDGYENATGWTFNKTSNGWFGVDDNRTIMWSNHDIYQVSDSIPVLYFEATELVPEVENATWYQIKGKTMTDFSDEAKRIDGEVATPLTPAQMLEIFRKAKSHGSLVGLENGYDVMFCDENKIALFFYSVKNGYSIDRPIYDCTSWTTEQGAIISFPYVPTENVTVYATGVTLSQQLYDYFGVNTTEYPYLFISAYAYSGTNKTFIEIIFTDSCVVYSNFVDLTGKTYRQSTEIGEVLSNNDELLTKKINAIMSMTPNLSFVEYKPTLPASFWHDGTNQSLPAHTNREDALRSTIYIID